MLRFLSWVPLRSGACRAFVVVAVAFTLLASKAAAQTTVDQHVPINQAVLNPLNPCTGELFFGSGFLHLKTFVTLSPNSHFSTELNVEDFKGATVTGVRYVATEDLTEHLIFDSDVAPLTENEEFTEHLVRQGEDGTFVMGDDFYIRIRAQFTINANGVVTVDNSEATATCK